MRTASELSVSTGTNHCEPLQQLPVNFKNGDSTTNFYVSPVVGGSVTPASTTDLIFKYAGVQD